MSTVKRGDPALLARLPRADFYAQDGYDFETLAEKLGWRMVASWGRDGWDHGDWPYVKYGYVDIDPICKGTCEGWRATDCAALPGAGRCCVACTHTEPPVFGYVSYCEGDHTVVAYATREERDRALDEAALFHWVHRRESWVEAVAKRRDKPLDQLTVDDLPPKFRGHFSWGRLKKERGI
jgi:hypothetical protein